MKDVDRILDDALASYTLQEPRAGFGARTMARVNMADTAVVRKNRLACLRAGESACSTTETSRPALVAQAVSPALVDFFSRPAPRWTWLSYATAVLALISLTSTVMMWRKEAPPPTPVRTPLTQRVPVLPAIVTTVKPAPRRDPLTSEQRALLTFTPLTPEASREMAETDKLLEIEEIKIQPLKIDGLVIGEIEWTNGK